MKRNSKFVKKVTRNWFAWSSYGKRQTMHIVHLCGAAWSSRWLMMPLMNGKHACELVFEPVTINLFSLYLMNFMFYTMLDAAGVVLRVHYKWARKWGKSISATQLIAWEDSSEEFKDAAAATGIGEIAAECTRCGTWGE